MGQVRVCASVRVCWHFKNKNKWSNTLALSPRGTGSRLGRCAGAIRSRRRRPLGVNVVSCSFHLPHGPLARAATRAAPASSTEGMLTLAMREMRSMRSGCLPKRRRPTWQQHRLEFAALFAWRSPCSSAYRRALQSGTLATTPSGPTECRPWHRRLPPHRRCHPRNHRLPLHCLHCLRPHRCLIRRRPDFRRLRNHHRRLCFPGTYIGRH